MIHLRASLENHRALCGAGPDEMSQSLWGLRAQFTMFCHLFRRPEAADYCPKCLEVNRRWGWALSIFEHQEPFDITAAAKEER